MAREIGPDQKLHAATNETPKPTLARVPPDWGVPLSENDYASLESSWISSEIAHAAMLRRVGTEDGRQIVGQKGKLDCVGVLIPNYWPGEHFPHSYRIRRDNPEWTMDKEGKPKPDRKYLGAPGSGNRLFFPPFVTPEHLADASIPVVIVEGEKKALALQRLALYERDTARFIPIAIAGVWNWRGTTGKGNGPNGERIEFHGPINDLDRITWADRKVAICFDANVHKNGSVRWARRGIAVELAKRNAEVNYVTVPEDCGVNGIDDLLAKWGPIKVLSLFEKPVRAASLQVVPPPQFESRPEGMFRVTTKGEQLSQVQLTNYRASVVTNIQIDDGVETRREFEIEAELLGRVSRFDVSAPKFAAMDWAIEKLGSSAITFPNQQDYARAAIQATSLMADDRSIYSHSGWRKIDGRWMYLHSGGAIGADGPVSGIDVRLPGALTRFELKLGDRDALVWAIRSSLRLLQLGPSSITYPLVSAVFRAVLGGVDFSLHMAGATGVFKSEMAALIQQFFGASMNRGQLPASWSSTGNSLETLCFHAKDVLVVVDDFAPQGKLTSTCWREACE